MTEWTERRWRWTFYFACFAFLAAFYAWYWNALTFDYCEGEKKWPCIRDWAFMLSGWGTVIGGGLAAFYVFHTLEETRKQTRFTIGDELPTVELLPFNETHDMVTFRIVNWNRNALRVVGVAWTVSGVEYPVEMITKAGMPEATVDDRMIFPAISISGWENRNAAGPPHVVLAASFMSNQVREMTDDIYEATGKLVLIGQLANNTKKQFAIMDTARMYQIYI